MGLWWGWEKRKERVGGCGLLADCPDVEGREQLGMEDEEKRKGECYGWLLVEMLL